MRVEVAYATPERQRIVTLEVEEGCTALAAAQQAGLEKDFPGLNPAGARMGIFGRLLDDPAATVLRPGDRVEIYRPLLADPKAARRQRAARGRA